MIPGSNLLKTRGSHLERSMLVALVLSLCSAAASAQTLVFKAELTGAAVVPPVTTPAMGTAYFIADLDADTLTYSMTFDQLSAAETGAQIEGFAAPGASGSMQVTLSPGKRSPACGTTARSTSRACSTVSPTS
jgi:hypothetical protein